MPDVFIVHFGAACPAGNLTDPIAASLPLRREYNKAFDLLTPMASAYNLSNAISNESVSPFHRLFSKDLSKEVSQDNITPFFLIKCVTKYLACLLGVDS